MSHTDAVEFTEPSDELVLVADISVADTDTAPTTDIGIDDIKVELDDQTLDDEDVELLPTEDPDAGAAACDICCDELHPTLFYGGSNTKKCSCAIKTCFVCLRECCRTDIKNKHAPTCPGEFN